MSIITCTRSLHFDAGHRVRGHEHHCKHVHGHRYVVEATFACKELDTVGRIIDFGDIYKILGDWLNSHWDHTLLLHEEDKPLGEMVSAYTGQKIYYFPYNPTAEYMAHYLYQEICPRLFQHHQAKCVKLRLYETPHCYAEVGAVK